MENQKQCKICKQFKPFSEFNGNASCKDGHSYTCRECISVTVFREGSGPFGHVKLLYKKGTEYYLLGEVNGCRIDKTFPYKNNGAYYACEEYYKLESDSKFGVGKWKQCGFCEKYKPITEFEEDDEQNDGYSRICNQCEEVETENRKKYNEKIAREGLYCTYYRDAEGTGWHNVNVKADGTVLRNSAIVKQSRNKQTPISSSQSKRGFLRQIMDIFKER